MKRSALLATSRRHLLTGAWTGSIYDAAGIDMMEQSLWLGLVPCAFLLMTNRGWRRAPAARRWLLVGGVFFVLALGPFLRVGGVDTSAGVAGTATPASSLQESMPAH